MVEITIIGGNIKRFLTGKAQTSNIFTLATTKKEARPVNMEIWKSEYTIIGKHIIPVPNFEELVADPSEFIIF